MSYDIYIGDADLNYTFNLSKLFHRHIQEGEVTGLAAIDGMTGRAASLCLACAFDRIAAERRAKFNVGAPGSDCRQVDAVLQSEYDAPNGWGSYIGALIFLQQIIGACVRHPRERVRVCK